MNQKGRRSIAGIFKGISFVKPALVFIESFQGNFLWKFPWNFLWKFPGNFPGSFMPNLTTWKLPIEEIGNYQISLKNKAQFLNFLVFKTQFFHIQVFLKLSETFWNLVKLCETFSWNFLWKLHAISKSWKLSIYIFKSLISEEWNCL